MSFFGRADKVRQTMHTNATAKAGIAATNIGGNLLDLGINTGIALVTKSPWAAAAAVASGALLYNSVFGDD